MKRRLRSILLILLAGLLLAGCRGTLSVRRVSSHDPTPTSTLGALTAPEPVASAPPTSPSVLASHAILVDDFAPQPLQGQPVYFYNRLGGDRGAVNDAILAWGQGQVTTTISAGNSWGGAWMSLNHPIREGLPINFSAVLPAQILPAYQSRISGLTVRIARGTPGRLFKLELKDGATLRWKNETVLSGGEQILTLDLPVLQNISQLVWVLDRASAGDSVVLDDIAFTATTQITETATAAFVWSYGMLLNNWNPATGLVRDKATDASGEFDAVQATGCLAAVTAIAEQLGVVSRAGAIQILNKIGDTLLSELPRWRGLWPHWVTVSPAGEIAIVPGTEWSSVDTVIAALGLLTAQAGLGLDPSATEHMLRDIDWSSLVTPGGISHGYTASGALIPYAWDAFGGESWLVELAYAAVTGQLAPMTYPSPPTANGSGFIDELAWLLVPPPSQPDHWGTDWAAYRAAAADKQIGYYPAHDPSSCFNKIGLFGLSAGEVPDPARVPRADIYQAFGLGGLSPANDGSALLRAPVVAPHYTAMIASLRPKEATAMWTWLIQGGFFSPLNSVESLMFPADSGCDPDKAVWNHLKGSWNLALQALGWGRYLAEQRGQKPILWQATTTDPFLRDGYRLLTLSGPAPSPQPRTISRECEYPDESTVGQTIERANASGQEVHGQFGTRPAWPAQPGYVKYASIVLPEMDQLYLRLHYSKYSPPSVPILIYLDDESAPRATYFPTDQGGWDSFAWTEPIPLGKVVSGPHSIKFATDGQEYGVADLDRFELLGERSASGASEQ